MTALLEVAGLGVRFAAGRGATVKAVDDVSLAVGGGRIVGVVGESGSGKTTLGRAILRLVEPSAGTVRFGGLALETLPPRGMLPVRRRMQAVFQDPTASLNPTMTVAQTVEEGLAIHRLGTRAERRERASAMLARVGLPASAADKRPRALSGGQRQRVGIARALVVSPELVIADEAVSALDVSVQAGIVNLLMDLREELRLAMLFIAHDLDLVRHFCDEVVVLYLGRVMEAGPTARVFAAPRHPYTRALIAAVPRIAPGGRGPRLLLAGEPPSPISPPSGCVFRTRCAHAIQTCAEVVPQPEGDGAHRAACIRQKEI